MRAFGINSSRITSASKLEDSDLCPTLKTHHGKRTRRNARTAWPLFPGPGFSLIYSQEESKKWDGERGGRWQ